MRLSGQKEGIVETTLLFHLVVYMFIAVSLGDFLDAFLWRLLRFLPSAQ